jgi:hypothetical protein
MYQFTLIFSSFGILIVLIAVLLYFHIASYDGSMVLLYNQFRSKLITLFHSYIRAQTTDNTNVYILRLN